MNGRWKTGTAVLAALALMFTAGTVAAEQADDKQASSDKQTPHEKQASDDGFGYDDVVAKAKALANKPYEPRDKVPKFLQELGFVGLNKINFKNKKALWDGEKVPYEARFYHPGSFFVYPVAMNMVTDKGVKPIPFSRDYFGYPSAEMRKKVPKDLGFAGVKILHHLNSSEYLDEVVSFLGASYFRALPKGAHYGLSARGLAIDTATSSGEEFPAFTQFWLVKPDAGDETLTLYALLDSPSVAGAYKFVVNTGETTTMDVSVTLFTRKAIEKLGIAPLTSMFAWGENSLHRLKNPRPEAHDSDGLLIHYGNGEWLWRPLKNPQKLTLNQFVVENLQGFGLLQRDRNFFHYQNLNYHYEDRPGAWVVPHGDWGPGVVELVQLPSDSEVNDNIVAYWIPKEPVKADEKLHFEYTLKWLMHEPRKHKRARTHATRIGYAAIVPGQEKIRLKVAIEFVGGKLDDIREPGKVEPRVSPLRDVTLSNIKAVPNPHTDGWRLSFLVPTKALEKPLELRAYLAGPNGRALTETWTYTLTE